jgi:hypothetical protein
MSRGKGRSPVPGEITALGRRVKRWRATREKRSVMPEPLWQEAVRLARVHGVSPVCRHVGLSYGTLRKRASAREDEPTRAPAAEAGFVEVNAAQLLSGSPGQTVLELSERDGTRLTVRLAAGSEVDVLGLVEGFRGLRR